MQIFKWAALAILIATLVMILRHGPPPEVPVDPQAPARVETKLQAAAHAAQSGQPHELRLDAAELNTFLQQNLALNKDTGAMAGSPAPATSQTDPTLAEAQSSVRDVKIAMTGDQIEAYLTFDFLGKDLSLDLEGRVFTEGGVVRFEPTGGKLGTFPLPQSALQEAVSRMMNSPENRDKLRLPPDVRDIHIENGELVVTYR